MKYKITKIYEDDKILEGYTDYMFAKVIGCTPMFINFLRHEKNVATLDFYNKIKEARKILDKKRLDK